MRPPHRYAKGGRDGSLEITVCALEDRQTYAAVCIYYLVPVIDAELHIVVVADELVEDLQFDNRVLTIVTLGTHKQGDVGGEP